MSELEIANGCLGGSKLDYIKRQAQEKIEEMTVQAKANISAYIDYKIYSTGLQELERLKIESKELQNG